MKAKVLSFTLVTGMFFAAVPPSPALANNLLTNPGFESGVATGWTTAGANWTAQSSVVHTGALAARNVIQTVPSQDYFASLSQNVSVPAGQTIYATLQAKTDINPRSSATAGLLIEFYQGAVLLSKKQDEIGGLTDWRQLYVSAVVPANTTSIKFHAFVFATQAESAPGGIALNGKAYFDEAVLSTDPVIAPAPLTNLQNAGFENGLHDWQLLFSPGGSLSADDQVKLDGSYSAKNTIGHSTSQSVFASAYQDLQYLGGPIYASAYVKTNINPGAAVAGLQIEYYNSSGASIGTPVKNEVSGVNDWYRLLINGVTPPAGTATLRLHVYTFDVQNGSAQGGTANFDSVIFSYTPLPPAGFQTTLLNNDFSNGLNFWSDAFGFPAQASTTAHSPTYSAQKTIGVIEGQDYYSQLYQDIYFDSAGNPFPGSQDTYVTAFVKTNFNPLAPGARAGLSVETYNGTTVTNTFKKDLTAVNDWRQLYLAFTIPAGTTKVRVIGFIFGPQNNANAVGGEAFFDDFVYSYSPIPVPPMPVFLTNGDFENGMNDWNDPFAAPAFVTNSIVHSGVYAVGKEMIFTPGLDYYGEIAQTIAATPGHDFRASVYAKTAIDPLSTAAVVMVVSFKNSSGTIVGSLISNQIGGTTDWTQLKAQGPVPVGAVSAAIQCILFAAADQIGFTGKAYFDDASSSSSPPRRRKPQYFSNL